MYQANITQRRVTIDVAHGKKEVIVEYMKRPPQVLRAMYQTLNKLGQSTGYMTAAMIFPKPSGNGVEIDIGDGESLLFDLSREVMYLRRTPGGETVINAVTGESRGPSDDNLEALMDTLLD